MGRRLCIVLKNRSVDRQIDIQRDRERGGERQREREGERQGERERGGGVGDIPSALKNRQCWAMLVKKTVEMAKIER